MKVFIIADGTSRRILPVSGEPLKCLITVEGKTILERILTAATRLPDVESVSVISGQKNEKLSKIIASYRGGIPLIDIPNPLAETRGSAFSLAPVIENISPDNLIIASDFFHHPALFKMLVSSPPNSLLIDNYHKFFGSEIKVCIENGFVRQMSRGIPADDAQGAFCGMLWLNDLYKNLIGAAISSAAQNAGIEDIITTIIDEGAQISLASTNNKPWMEIMTDEDVERAETDLMMLINLEREDDSDN